MRMQTYEQVKREAERCAGRALTTGERDEVLALLAERYVSGFLQGYTRAGGILSAAEAEAATDPAEKSDNADRNRVANNPPMVQPYGTSGRSDNPG